MQLFDFKGGIGTSSRVVSVAQQRYAVGVLVMTNFGARHELRIDGIPVGRMLSDEQRASFFQCIQSGQTGDGQRSSLSQQDRSGKFRQPVCGNRDDLRPGS